MPVPPLAADPLPDQREQSGVFDPCLLLQPFEKQIVRNFVEKCADIRVNDKLIALIMQLPQPCDCAVDPAPRPVREGAFEELFFKGSRQRPRGRGLQYAVPARPAPAACEFCRI